MSRDRQSPESTPHEGDIDQLQPISAEAQTPQVSAAVGPSDVASWLDSLGTGTENDTMLRFTPSQHNAIDLTEANNSGLMQLLGGRRTRLSTLLNDSSAFDPAAKAASRIRQKIREMRDDRGIEVGFLAAGIASWTEHTDAGAETFTAPVMLVPISLRSREDTFDFELQFSDTARLNPALARHLDQVHRVRLKPVDFHRAGYITARFDPNRTAELLSSVADVDGLQVWKQLYVSTFADLAHLGNPDSLDLEHPVLQALAADSPLPQADALTRVETLDSPDERDVESERLVVDADSDQQKALDAITSGVSTLISAPPGTGETQTAINAAAALAWSGKRVLVVAERAETLTEFSQRLTAARIGTLGIHVPAAAEPQALRDQVVRAIRRAEKAEPPRLNALHQRLTARRHQLRDHVASLHKVRERWGCSPYHAMQALAALTSLTPPPGTAVRLKRSVLDNTVERSQVAVKLRRAAELGAFSGQTRTSPWFGARLSNRQETQDALELVEKLREELPHCGEQMVRACESVGLTPGASFAEWHSQVLLFQRIQDSLGRFTQDIYARDVDDLIAATASGSWRRRNNVEMTSVVRSRLRRVAKEYVRPSVSINDLHDSLQQVQSEREEWMKSAAEDQRPSVPRHLDQLVDLVAGVQRRLERLVAVLVATEEETLFDVPFKTLLDTVEQLGEDEQSLVTLPERTLLSEQLREQGFAELLEDLAAREVHQDQVADELELAWWQSALEAMISGDDYLAMTSGENLRSIEADYRRADSAHIAAGAGRLSHELAVDWKQAVETSPQAADALRTLLREEPVTVEALESIDSALIQPLVPIWTTSPLGLVEQFPDERGAGESAPFDTVLLLDAETLAVPAALGAVSRAEQVVAFGDPISGAPKPLTVSADPIAREAESRLPQSIYSELARVLPERRLRQVHRGVDEQLTRMLSAALYEQPSENSDNDAGGSALLRLPDASALTGHHRRFSVETVLGARSGGREPMESPTAEVNRVVDLVFDHVRRHRNRSLAVVTGSSWHATRVAEAIRMHLANHPWAQEYFQHGAQGVPGGSGSGAAGEGTGELFVVTPVERAFGVVRDDVIFSLGFGRTVKGEATHQMGELSGARGREYFAQAVTRARGTLNVVSSLQPHELDPARLEEGAALVRQLLLLEQQDAGVEAGAEVLTDPLVLDMVDRIRARGGRVEGNFAGTVDLAACLRRMTAETRSKPVAMMSDGTDRYASLSVRERSRLRPQTYERLGWQHMVLWTIEVFSDPAAITERVADAVGLGPGPDFAQHGRSALGADAAGQVRFGGAADAGDRDAQRHHQKYLSPRERGRHIR